MAFPSITAGAAAFFALLLVALSINTSARRARVGVTFGDGGDETLRQRIRAHGNFIEYAPLALIVLGLVELSGAARGAVIALALAFCGARLLHAVGMLYAKGPALRGIGMLVQHGAFLYGAFVLASAAG